jgi:Skp family chaperone for outer membrane proteins
VKRTVSILVAVATVGIAVYVGSRLWAQQPNTTTRPAAPLQTRVALVNLGQVIKNYQKFKTYQDQMKQKADPLQKEFETKKALITQKQALANKPDTSAAQREQLQREVKAMEREMQDKADEANANFSKERVDQLVTIYRDVQEAVAAYARSYAIELVLQYTDGVESEKYNPANLQQKLGNQACMPIYNDPRMDITAAVITMLNQHLQQASAAPAAPR